MIFAWYTYEAGPTDHGDDAMLAARAEDMRSTPWWYSIPTNEYTYCKSAEISGEC